jgi:hypothetical protein
MVISLHMDADGLSAWPSQKTIATRALVSRRSVVTHLEEAEQEGWVRRYDARPDGPGWRLCGYEATVPDAVYEALPERPWEVDPSWRRGEHDAPRCPVERGESAAPRSPTGNLAHAERGANVTRDVVQLTTERGATDASRGAKLLHTNLPSESSQESSLRRNVRLTRTSSANGSDEARATDPEKIRKLLDIEGNEPGDVARLLGTSVEEVLRVKAAGSA